MYLKLCNYKKKLRLLELVKRCWTIFFSVQVSFLIYSNFYSGKQKLEKRIRKQGNEVSGVGVDTPLNTVAVMINQQKDKQLPYVVLSGGGKNITVDK